MIVLSASNLTKIYGTDVIVKGVDFHINSGDRVGLIGRNGAGKTTLLNMITGQLRPDEGQIFVSAGARIGDLKQRDSFDPENTVMGEIENVFGQIRKLEEDINKTADQISQNPGDESLLNRLYRLQHEFEARGGYTYRSEATVFLHLWLSALKAMTRRSRLCPAEKGPGCLWQRCFLKSRTF